MLIAPLEAGLAVLIGGLLYLLARPDGLRMFDWARALGAGADLEHARARLRPAVHGLPEWVRFSLPDALWAFAFTSALCALWGQKLTRHSAAWLALGPALSLGSELAQGLGLVRGTFDVRDLTLSLVACALGLRRVRVSPLVSQVAR